MLSRQHRFAQAAIDGLIAGEWTVPYLSPEVKYVDQPMLFSAPLRHFFRVEGQDLAPNWTEHPEVWMDWSKQEAIPAPYLEPIGSCWVMPVHMFINHDADRIAAFSGLFTLRDWETKEQLVSLFDKSLDGDPVVLALSSTPRLEASYQQSALEEAFHLSFGLACGDSREFFGLLDAEYDCPP